MTTETIEVIATERGYINDRIRETGERFTVPAGTQSRWFTPVKNSKEGTVESDITKLSVPKLKELAAHQGLDVSPRATKAELIALLTAGANTSDDDETDLA